MVVRLSYHLSSTLSAESVAQDMVRNALHSLSDLGVTEYYDIANEKMASITDEYNSAGRLNELISRIDSYKSD